MSMSAPTITIELHAVWRGGRWEAIDEDGRCICTVSKRLVRVTTAQQRSPGRFEPLRKWAVREASRLRDDAKRAELAAWGRKFQSLAASVVTRKRKRCGHGKRSGRIAGRSLCTQSWNDCIRNCMAVLKGRCKRSETRNEWHQWSETVAGNIRKRAAARACYGAEDEGAT